MEKDDEIKMATKSEPAIYKRVCPKHGEYESQALEFFNNIIASACPICLQEAEAAAVTEREAIIRDYREKDMLKRGIEADYFNATFDGFHAENETEENALNAVKELNAGTLEKVLLLGSNGTGKTYLGCVLVKNWHGVRITMFELSARIRAGFNTGKSELEILDELLDYPAIVLDEIGRTKGSESEKNWLSYLIDKAHTKHKKLLIISNRQTAKRLPPERRGDAIESYFDNDVISRLRQNSKIVEVTGRDRRATCTSV